jgi:transcriptional regulator with XRE-family HTH domain
LYAAREYDPSGRIKGSDPGVWGGILNKSETTGSRIRRLRLEQGLSLRDIEGVGADHAHISRVETGRRPPTEEFLRTVARNLGVSVDYLRDGKEGGAAARRRARLDDLELRLRLNPAEDAAEIESALRALHSEAFAAGDFTVANRSRMLSGCLAADRGAHAEAVTWLERLVQRGLVSPVREPDVYLSLGRSLAALGRADDAATLFESCLAEIEEKHPTDRTAFVRFSTYLSYALTDAGEQRRAKRVLQEALARADDIDNAASRARLFYSRARLAWADCEWEEGRAYAERAIALLELSEDAQDVIRMHLLCADIAVLTGDIDEAEGAAASAEALMRPETDAQDIASLRCQQALIAARRGEAGRATALAHEAIGLLVDDPATQGRAYWALAEALAADDRVPEALEIFRRAYELMSIERRFLPQLLQAWVQVLRDVGQYEEATDLFITALNDGVFAGREFAATGV